MRTYLYRLSREAFNTYASSYYRDPRFWLAEPLAADILDIGEAPLEMEWPFSSGSLRGLPDFMHRDIRRAFGVAWGSQSYVGPSPRTVGYAVERGRFAAHVPEQPSTEARFLVPREVTYVARSLGRKAPDIEAVRDALRSILERLRTEDVLGKKMERELEQEKQRFDAFSTGVSGVFGSLFRSDLTGAVGNVVAVVSALAEMSVAPSPSRFKYNPRGYQRSIEFVQEALVTLDAWEASGAEARLEALRAFYRDAAAAAEYVVIERSPRRL